MFNFWKLINRNHSIQDQICCQIYTGSSAAFRRVHTSILSNRDIKYSEYVSMVKEGAKTVDVRNIDEIKNMGGIKGSLEIPLGQLKQEFTLSPSEWKEKYRSVKPSLETPVVLFCASGVRSKTGVKILKDLGYTKLMSYRGGFKMYKDKK